MRIDKKIVLSLLLSCFLNDMVSHLELRTVKVYYLYSQFHYAFDLFKARAYIWYNTRSVLHNFLGTSSRPIFKKSDWR